MSGDPLVTRSGDFTDGVDFRLVHYRLVRPRHRHEFIARRVYLQRVDPFAHHFPRGAAELVRAVADDGEGFAVHVRQPHIAQTTGHRHFRRGRQHAWAGAIAGIDRVTKHHIQSRLGGGGAVDTGKSLIEHPAGVLHRQDRMFFGRNFTQSFQTGGIAEGDMAVGFHKAGHQRLAATVYFFRSTRRSGIVPGQRLDPASVDMNGPVKRRRARSIQNTRILQKQTGHDPSSPYCYAALSR